MQVSFIGDGEEQAVITPPMLDKGSDVQTEMESRPRFGAGRHAHPVQGVWVIVILVPAAFFTPVGKDAGLPRNWEHSVSWFVGIVTILTRKAGERRRGR
jgi:hypothetical protein